MVTFSNLKKKEHLMRGERFVIKERKKGCFKCILCIKMSDISIYASTTLT
jgi:hypothetical protein